MLKLKLQYFSHLMRTDDSLEKSLMLGKIKGRRRRERQRMRWLDGITEAMNVNSHQLLGDGEGQGGLVCCAVHGVAKCQMQLGDWTITTMNHNHVYHLWKYIGLKKCKDHYCAFIQVWISKSLVLPPKLCFLILSLLFCKMTFKYNPL